MAMQPPTEAYPLAWPEGWRRTPKHERKYGRFSRRETRQGSADYSWTQKASLSVAGATERVIRELETMDAQGVVVSTNLELTLRGLPRSGQRQPDDPGVAVYWKDRRAKAWRCMAIDRYERVEQNLAAVAATLAAMRAIERHGGAEILDRAFTGFVALPSPEQPWQVLGLATSRPTRDEIETAYRRLAMKHHPDRGGDPAEMARINAARDALLGDAR